MTAIPTFWRACPRRAETLSKSLFLIFFSFHKGQQISEWKYEVVALPKIWTKKIEKFCPEYLRQNFSNYFVHILGNATTSYFHSEIFWPLGKVTKDNVSSNFPSYMLNLFYVSPWSEQNIFVYFNKKMSHWILIRNIVVPSADLMSNIQNVSPPKASECQCISLNNNRL